MCFSANLMISLRETPLEEGSIGQNLNKGEKCRIILEGIMNILPFMDCHPIPGRMNWLPGKNPLAGGMPT